MYLFPELVSGIYIGPIPSQYTNSVPNLCQQGWDVVLLWASAGDDWFVGSACRAVSRQHVGLSSRNPEQPITWIA